MSTYEVEHNTTTPQTGSNRRRPDLSTFFTTLSEITPESSRHRPHAVPVPGDISAAFYSLAEALDVIRREGGDGSGPRPGATAAAGAGEGEGEGGGDLVAHMIQALLQEADTPPREVEGVSEEFCDVLDRVPRKNLTKSQVCPICNNPFLEDEYPLVVQLPCHSTHMFDLECVRPWLRLRGTCPLDRRDFGKEEREKKAARTQEPAVDEEDEEWDGMYG